MSQIWITLIANLIFTIIFQRNKQGEVFVTMVSMARSGLNTYVFFLTIIKQGKLNSKDRDNRIIQLQLFNINRGVFFKTKTNTPV